MMTSLLRQLLPLAPPAPVTPIQNTFRLYAVPLDGQGLIYLRQILEVDLAKFAYDFEDEDSAGLTSELLLQVEKLLPAEPANVVMTGWQYDRLVYYLDDRLVRMGRSNRPLLCTESVEALASALKQLRAGIVNYTEVRPLNGFWA